MLNHYLSVLYCTTNEKQNMCYFIIFMKIVMTYTSNNNCNKFRAF